MPRNVRCGLIQASNALPPTDPSTPLEAVNYLDTMMRRQGLNGL